MTQDQALQGLQAIIKGMGKGTITINSHLTEEGILDSIEVVDFMLSVEKQFSVRISEAQILENELTKIANLVNLLSAH